MNDDDKAGIVASLVDEVRANGWATVQVSDGRVMLIATAKLREVLDKAGDAEMVTVFLQSGRGVLS
jgi:hypothetical protein